MLNLPPLPDWSQLHPLIIHFPIGLLFVSPLFVVLGLFFKKKRDCFFLSGFILMLLGTISGFATISTGEAAARIADRSPEINKFIMKHESLAERSIIFFTILTLLFALILFLPKILKKELKEKILWILMVLYLVFYLLSMGLIANTAHNGGILVHGLGVHSLVDVPSQ